MTSKTAQSKPETGQQLGLRDLQAQVETLQLELAQKNLEMAQKDLLVHQGHQAFLEAAEKLQYSYKRLQEEVAGLNLELDQKNKELERNLIERDKVKNYLSNIFESQANGVFVTDLQGRVTSVNRSGLRMLGAKAQALTGRHINKVLRCKVVPAKAEPMTESGGMADFQQSITFTREDGEALKLQASGTVMNGENQQPLGYIVNVHDVTKLKRLEEHAERRNRFTAMGEMAANIAHEIRNPLGSIELFASLVRKGLMEGDERLELVNHISTGVASMNHIISNLLEYTKPRPVSLQKVNLHHHVSEVAEFTRFSASQNQVDLKLGLKAKRFHINGDPEHLKQVFHNLILNAVQAMPEGGGLNIASRVRTLTSPGLLRRFGDGAAEIPGRLEVVELSFKDTGMGMPEEVQNQIFDPFYSTKARGTGLGLAIVQNIIESHQGIIDVESRNHQGTTFVLMFPLLGKERAGV